MKGAAKWLKDNFGEEMSAKELRDYIRAYNDGLDRAIEITRKISRYEWLDSISFAEDSKTSKAGKV